MAAPDKAAQEAEAAARLAGDAVNPAENAYAAVGADVDGTGADPGGTAPPPRAAAPQPGEDAPRAPPPARSPFQTKRDEIIGRFRVDRGAEPDDSVVDANQMNEFVRSGMPPEFSEPNAAVAEPPAPEAQLEPAPAPVAPRMVTLTVHGKKIQMTEDEALAKAQIALASENILDDAKSKMREIDTLLGQARDRVQRADPPAQHQGRQDGAQPAEPAAPAGDQSPHQDDQIAKLIETIQFGDPGEARTLLDNTIQQRAETVVSKAVPQALEAERFRDEGARTQKVLADFLDKHADLASDEMAHAAIERNVFSLQLEDIKALGVDPSTLPGVAGTPTPAQIASAHLWYRTKGFKVRRADELLETAKDNFLKWKGTVPQPSETNPAAPAPKGAPPAKTIEVIVDRGARQQAVPQQPSRTVNPRPDPAPASAQRTDGSSIVAGMRARRGLPRGQAAS